jgi:hypothetical protein
MCIAKESTTNFQLKIKQTETNSKLDKANHKFATLEISQTRTLNTKQPNENSTQKHKIATQRNLQI